ncbi:hypothetical protein CPC08DRAFT_728804 [Agrocybe pediades]|nr:hypothetical protein CPC08DRAFT_728804 [Agrocybe pediades]
MHADALDLVIEEKDTALFVLAEYMVGPGHIRRPRINVDLSLHRIVETHRKVHGVATMVMHTCIVRITGYDQNSLEHLEPRYFDISDISVISFEHSSGNMKQLEDVPLVLLRFFSRCNFPLTKLSLSTRVFTPGDMARILETAPSLIHLSVRFSEPPDITDSNAWGSTDSDSSESNFEGAESDFEDPESKTWMESFFQHLSQANPVIHEGVNNAHNLAPRLESLEFVGEGLVIPWIFAPAIFGDPSEPRTAGRRPLKALTFYSKRVPDPVSGLPDETIARLLSLREAGIAINYCILPDRNLLVPVVWNRG